MLKKKKGEGAHCTRFCIRAVALALGSVWALGVLITGWAAAVGWGTLFVKTMASIYIGYKPGFVGGIIGGIWAFFYAAIGGAIFAFLYDFFVTRFK